LDYVNSYTKLRGPDHTGIIKKNNITFLHNLLSITGEFTIQPFVEDDIVCLYNGEIYNAFDFGNYKSDGECLIPLYKKYGIDFIKKLDGEFAVVLFDFARNIVVLSTDIFATKPIWMAKDAGNFCICSYKSNADRLGFKDVKRLSPNTVLVLDINLDQRDKYEIYSFSLDQHKKSFADWNVAFYNSINKRCLKNVRESIFIGLSSGYDSGAIACELINQKVQFSAYTIMGSEDKNIMSKRSDYLKKNGCEITISDSSSKAQALRHLNDFVEEYYYVTYCSKGDYNEYDFRLHQDHGSTGISMICMMAKKNNKKIYLSGQGADEIFSDYGFKGRRIFRHSNFGGLFPNDLKTIFPWPSFYESSQRSYLTKEEYVAGSYGIEARYPFLDKDVIQEFLWLSVDMKNKNYKNVLHNLMSERGFPFNVGVKTGFCP
jgi:asparagine synthase (glutamine-hydrolysing)